MTEKPDQRWLFHYGQTYLERGYSILPLAGKQPDGPWKIRQKMRMTLGEVTHLWGGLNKNPPNMGIVTGSVSDLTVVDCDNRAESEWWYRTYPRTPLMVKTGRGVHFYYRHGGNGNRRGVLGRKIDIQDEGGYAVAPSSIHPKTKKPYYWVKDIEDYRLDDVPTFEPEWIKEQVAEIPVRDGIRNVRGYISRIIAVSGEHGHNATFRAACKCRDSGLSQEETIAEMVLWNQTNAQPPWTVRDLLHKVKDAYTRTTA